MLLVKHFLLIMIFPSGDGTRNGFVMKLDTNGIFVSSNTYGGTLDDAFESITSLSSGYLAVNGWTESIDGDIIGNHGPSLNSDMFFCKVNTNLDLISTLCVGSTGSENGYSVIESGGAIFLGGCGQAAVNGDVTQIFGYPDICVAKLDTLSSSVLWCTMYGGTKYEFGGF